MSLLLMWETKDIFPTKIRNCVNAFYKNADDRKQFARQVKILLVGHALLLVAFGLIVRWPKLPTLQCALDIVFLMYTSFAHPLGPWAPVDRVAWVGAHETVHIYEAT